ncbi:MAG: DUF2312 domain-containing protein [Magnetococcales bacterium]|nr:DUF2312 domain-containing protein [Magnetococcales bacterium]
MSAQTNPKEDDNLLKPLVDRIERLEEEKADLAAAIREVYAEAKSLGFDPKVIRELIKIRKMDSHDLDEKEALLHLYKQAMGMG